MVSENFKDYTVDDDVAFQDFKDNKRDLSVHTLRNYKVALNMFCRANEKTLDDICDTCEAEQVDKIVNDEVHRFSPNNRKASIKRYFNTFINFCKANENKASTINARVRDLRVFFNSIDIEPPNLEKLKEEKKEWSLLTKDDINFIMNDVTLTYKALITFLLSTGMREADACNLTIGDFMKATKEYHDFVDVEEFIDNAQPDMIGYWNFEPQKTRSRNVHCKTFNSPESSNYILQNLRKIKNENIPKINKEKNLDLKISKKHALFGSKKKKFLEKMNPKNVTDNFIKKNKKLRTHHIINIDQKIAEGKISHEDRDEYIEKIPNFHPHALRKYFITTINSYGDYRTCLVLEGHKSEIKTDESYIKIKKDEVKEVYLNALHELTLEPIEARILTDTETEKLKQESRENKQKINELTNIISKKDEETENRIEKINEKHDKEIENVKQELTKKYEKEMQKLREEISQVNTKVENINKPKDNVDTFIIAMQINNKRKLSTIANKISKESNENPHKILELLSSGFKRKLKENIEQDQENGIFQPENEDYNFNLINRTLSYMKLKTEEILKTETEIWEKELELIHEEKNMRRNRFKLENEIFKKIKSILDKVDLNIYQQKEDIINEISTNINFDEIIGLDTFNEYQKEEILYILEKGKKENLSDDEIKFNINKFCWETYIDPDNYSKLENIEELKKYFLKIRYLQMQQYNIESVINKYIKENQKIKDEEIKEILIEALT